MPESTLCPSQGLRIWPQRELDRIQGCVRFVLWRGTVCLCSEIIFMYLRAIFCTFQISVDFYFVPVGGRGGGRGSAGEGEGAIERGG
jgi:hypothetical protein